MTTYRRSGHTSYHDQTATECDVTYSSTVFQGRCQTATTLPTGTPAAQETKPTPYDHCGYLAPCTVLIPMWSDQHRPGCRACKDTHVLRQQVLGVATNLK